MMGHKVSLGTLNIGKGTRWIPKRIIPKVQRGLVNKMVLIRMVVEPGMGLEMLPALVALVHMEVIYKRMCYEVG